MSEILTDSYLKNYLQEWELEADRNPHPAVFGSSRGYSVQIG